MCLRRSATEIFPTEGCGGGSLLIPRPRKANISRGESNFPSPTLCLCYDV